MILSQFRLITLQDRRGHKAMMLSDVWRLSCTLGLSQEQRGLRLKLAQR